MPGRLVKRTWEYNPTLYAPAKYKRACKYETFTPDALVGMEMRFEGTVAGIVSEAENAIRALNDSAEPAFRPLAQLLLRTESIASSKVEGMQVGVRELARAEARADSGAKVGATTMEVLANIDAMVVALEEASKVQRFDAAQIVAIHRRLLEREKPKIAGRIRGQQNWIGGNDFNPCGADFVPPPPKEVRSLLGDLCDAINDDLLPPIVQAALVHAQFESIHPFDDGNGRTGRALIHVVLRRRNVAPKFLPPISIVLASNKTRYISSLTSFRSDDIGPWIEYFAAAAARAAYLAKAYLIETEALKTRWRQQLADAPTAPRSDATAWALIDALPGHPMITAAAAAAATGRTLARIYDAIEQLQEVGILIPLASTKRNQSWEVSGLLELVARMEDGRGL